MFFSLKKHCLLNFYVNFIYFSENLIKLLISARDLKEEQSKAFHTILSEQVKTYLEVHDHSTDKLKEVGALNKFITKNYRLLFKYAVVGSLVIVLNCQRIESLEHLWNDFLSGHLDKVAERYLVTDEMKERLNLETINLKTTIEEEKYLNCRKVLMDCTGYYKCLFGQSNIMGGACNVVYVYNHDFRQIHCTRVSGHYCNTNDVMMVL